MRMKLSRRWLKTLKTKPEDQPTPPPANAAIGAPKGLETHRELPTTTYTGR